MADEPIRAGPGDFAAFLDVASRPDPDALADERHAGARPARTTRGRASSNATTATQIPAARATAPARISTRRGLEQPLVDGATHVGFVQSRRDTSARDGGTGADSGIGSPHSGTSTPSSAWTHGPLRAGLVGPNSATIWRADGRRDVRRPRVAGHHQRSLRRSATRSRQARRPARQRPRRRDCTADRRGQFASSPGPQSATDGKPCARAATRASRPNRSARPALVRPGRAAIEQHETAEPLRPKRVERRPTEPAGIGNSRR